MNLSAIKQTVTSKVGRQILLSQKHSPTVLFGVGVVGVVATAVLTAKATLRVDGVLDELEADKSKAAKVLAMHRSDYTEADYKKDITFIYVRHSLRLVKLYAPAIVTGVITIGALAGSHNIMSRRNAGLTAAYAALDKGFREYRARVVEEYGEDKDRELRYGAVEREVLYETKKGEPKTKKVTSAPATADHSIYARFFDEVSPQWKSEPGYNKFFLQSQQAQWTNVLHSRGHVFLNEVYDALGIDRTPEGAVVGWILGEDEDNFVDFGVYNHESERARLFVNGGEKSILLDFNVSGVIFDKIGKRK